MSLSNKQQRHEYYLKHKQEINQKCRDYYKANKAKVKQNQKLYRIANKERVNLVKKFGYKRDGWHNKTLNEHSLKMLAFAFLGGKCVRCGFSDPRALQIDHIKGGGGIEAATIGLQAIRRKIVNGETKDYQLLCANCNWIKRYENKELGKGKLQRLDTQGFPIHWAAPNLV